MNDLFITPDLINHFIDKLERGFVSRCTIFDKFAMSDSIVKILSSAKEINELPEEISSLGSIISVNNTSILNSDSVIKRDDLVNAIILATINQANGANVEYQFGNLDITNEQLLSVYAYIIVALFLSGSDSKAGDASVIIGINQRIHAFYSLIYDMNETNLKTTALLCAFSTIKFLVNGVLGNCDIFFSLRNFTVKEGMIVSLCGRLCPLRGIVAYKKYSSYDSYVNSGFYRAYGSRTAIVASAYTEDPYVWLISKKYMPKLSI